MSEVKMKCMIDYGPSERGSGFINVHLYTYTQEEGQDVVPGESIVNIIVPEKYKIVADMIHSALEVGIAFGFIRPESGS